MWYGQDIQGMQAVLLNAVQLKWKVQMQPQAYPWRLLWSYEVQQHVLQW